MSGINSIPNGVRSGSYFRSISGPRAPVSNSREPVSDTSTTRIAPSTATTIDSRLSGSRDGSTVEQPPKVSSSPSPPSLESAAEPERNDESSAVDSAAAASENNSTQANRLSDGKARDEAKPPGRPSNDKRAEELQGQVVNGKQLTPAQLDQLRRLRNQDVDVRQHEQAHLAAGGSLVRGGASFEYQTGSDGKQYAVGGEVQIDVPGKSGDLNATLAQLQQVRAAALAPVAPSGQDLFVASEADRLAIATRQEIQQQSAQASATSTNSLSENEAAAEIAKGVPKSPSDIGQSLAQSSLPQFPVHPPKPSALQQIVDTANRSTAPREFGTTSIIGQEIDFTA